MTETKTKYGIREDQYGHDRARIIKIVRETERTVTYIDQKRWDGPDFSGGPIRMFAKPLITFETLAEAESAAALANAVWRDWDGFVLAAQNEYVRLQKEQRAAFLATLGVAK